MVKSKHKRFERYVAIGDSSTEGFNDPDGAGGYRGWSRRLAARIAHAQGELLYANFGVRGLTTRQILDQQLVPALAMRPDLVTMFSGTNDVIGLQFDAPAIARDMEHMQRTFIDDGATVLTFTLPDLTPIMPSARWIAPRIHAMNDGLRTATARTRRDATRRRGVSGRYRPASVARRSNPCECRGTCAHRRRAGVRARAARQRRRLGERAAAVGAADARTKVGGRGQVDAALPAAVDRQGHARARQGLGTRAATAAPRTGRAGRAMNVAPAVAFPSRHDPGNVVTEVDDKGVRGKL